MPDPFFATNSRKRKRSASSTHKSAPKKKTAVSNGKSKSKPSTSTSGPSRLKKRTADEELSDATEDGDDNVDDLDLRVSDEESYQSGSENEDETPAEKRLRLAQLYLDGVKNSLADGEFDAAEIDKELISARLKKDVMEHTGKVHLFIADKFDFIQSPNQLRTRGHRFTVTTAVASEDGKFLYTAGKEGSIIKWNLQTGKKISVVHKQRQQKGKQREEVNGHTDEIWTLALSTDGKFLASGGKDRRVGVWNVENEGIAWLKGFGGHRDSISCLAFRKSSHQLYTGSHDRTLKLFDLSVMGYVETLFGHQDFVLSVDSLRGETAVSCGGRDRTVRFWKIVDETQLVFRGGGRSKIREVLEGGAFGGVGEDEDEPKQTTVEKSFIEGSMECVAMIDEATFLSGGNSGSISLWATQKKKPVFTQALAHGLNETISETRGVIKSPRWITGLGSLPYSDIFASGSWDGQIRMWKLDSKLRSFTLVGCIAAPGVVNSIQLLSLPRETNLSWDHESRHVGSVLLVAGMGQEHRMGRWISIKEPGSFNGCLAFVFHQRTPS